VQNKNQHLKKLQKRGSRTLNNPSSYLELGKKVYYTRKKVLTAY